MYATKPISQPINNSPTAATANMMMVSGAVTTPSLSITGKSTTVIANAIPTRKNGAMFMLPKNGEIKKMPLILVSVSKNAAICP